MEEKTPIHKIELYVIEINNEGYGVDDIVIRIKNCLKNELVATGEISTKDTGEWSDEHILNQIHTDVKKEFDNLPTKN